MSKDGVTNTILHLGSVPLSGYCPILETAEAPSYWRTRTCNQSRIQTFPMGTVLAGVCVLRIAFITYLNNAAVFFVHFLCRSALVGWEIQ